MSYPNIAPDDLVGNNSRFKRLADSGIIGIFEGNARGQILDGNGTFLRMLGYSEDDLTSGRIRWDQITVPGYEQVNRVFREQLTTSGVAAPAELEYLRKDGSALPAFIGLASIQGAGGEDQAIGFVLDLTEQRRVQEALKKSEEKFRQLAENIQEVFWMMDAAGKEMIYVSPAYELIWGRRCDGLYDNPESWMHSIHGEDRKQAEKRFARQVQGEVIENEYRIVQPSGAIRWIRDRAFPVRDKAGKTVRIAGIAEDITDRKVSELHLQRQACYDELTDLPNRRLFRERLSEAIAGCTPGRSGAVFFIDLDEFKLVNDTFGHSAGDQLLKEVSGRLLAVCSGVGTLARFGGDEFTFLTTQAESSDSVRALGERLIQCLSEPFRIGEQEVFLSASIGISLFPENGTDPDVLKKEANIAMHEAKRTGKNQIGFFTAGLADAAIERMEMESRLRRALRRGEFKLQFQPQFCAGSSRPRCFEALIRWCSPDHPPVPPLKFIPLAEQNGLIVPIGTWALNEACQRCAGWQTGKLRGTRVAVNVSALQFACPDFVETVARVLNSTGLSPELLELELTESVFMRDISASSATLKRLRNLGVTIALDDFGTGFSSLSYLQNLPLDALKIDRSFLMEAQSSQQGAAVLRCVVGLAHTLGLRVIGEGVETPAQFDLLRNLGCDEIQGFLLGKPAFEVAGWELAAGLGQLGRHRRSEDPPGDGLRHIPALAPSESFVTTD